MSCRLDPLANSTIKDISSLAADVKNFIGC
jgi:hypothetical protein